MYKPSFSQGEIRVRTPSFILPSNKMRIAYTYIRKNACSTFKTYLTRCAGATDISDPEVRKLRVNLDRYNVDRLKHTIFVYRDPFDRLVSGFLNKLVARRSKSVFDIYRNKTRSNPLDANFMDFICYLNDSKEEVDSHFWPQKAHLSDITYTLPIHISQVTEVLSRLLNGQPHVEVFTKKANETRYDKYAKENLLNTSVRKLIAMHDSGQAFAKESFRSPEVLDRLKELYASDYEMIAEIRDRAGEVPKQDLD